MMADDAAPVSGETSPEAPITINIKSSNDARYTLTVPLTQTVLDLKNTLASKDYADIPADRQRLIYSGRVLKDADTLATYKIKEGNTVHLVKGAASNQRQSPPSASAGVGAAGPGTGTQPGVAGVPTNLAAGTGNNPLAGLTGARYAGYAQLPGAGMFGPDGGMGPPPNPEEMIQLLSNPQFASTLDEALSNPQLIDQMIQSNPMLRGMGPQVRAILQNPEYRRMITDPQVMRQMHQMQRNMPGMFGMGGGMGGDGGNGAFPAPGATNQTPEGAARAGNEGNPLQNQGQQRNPSNPFGMFGGMNPFGMMGNPVTAGTGSDGAAAGQQQQQQQQQPFNPFAMLLGAQPQAPSPAPRPTGPNDSSAPPSSTSNNTSTDAATPQTNNESNPSTNHTPANPIQPTDPNNPFDHFRAMMAQGTQQQQQTGQPHPMAALMQMPWFQQAMQQAPFGGAGEGGGTGANPLMGMFGGGAGGGDGMGMGMGMGGQGQQQQPPDNRPPEERYADQLRQLNDMGFFEFERNVAALRRSGGNVQGAIEYLLG